MHKALKPTLSDKQFNALSKIVHGLTGITIRPERKIMLEGRLSKRLRALEFNDFDAYIDYIGDHSDEQEAFINAVTTNETYFYRTPRIWEYIEDKFLQQWYSENKGQTLTAWSAASSTGEEAHTLGIVLQDFKERNTGFRYQIIGTDIDSSVLQTATKGLYNGRSIFRFRNDKENLFSRYMSGNDESGYTVVPEIKENIKFKHLNLFKPGNFNQKYSLVLLRNVLIYFNKQDQENLMNLIHQRLNSSGIVVIGESESLNNLSTQFSTIVPTIYERSENARKADAA